METPFECALCMAPVATVPVRLNCCRKVACLTCTRDMFGLNTKPFADNCSLCGCHSAPDDVYYMSSSKNFYTILNPDFQSFDEKNGSIFMCPRKCEFSGTTADIHTHLSHECINSYTNCMNCGRTMIRSDLAAHVQHCEVKKCRSCFCNKESLCKMEGYKKHIQAHTEEPEYELTCKMYTDPDVPKKPKMIRCKFSLDDEKVKGEMGVFSGCSCGELFTLADFVEHVLKM